MQVLGLDDNGNYIASVSHAELEKSAGKYFGKMPRLKVGERCDIGAGYNFANDIKAASQGMIDAIKGFDRAQATLTTFAIMAANLPVSADGQEAYK